MAPYIEKVYDCYQKNGVWPNQDETEEILSPLRAELGVPINFGHNSIAPTYIVVSLGWKRYVYYYFITCDNINSNNQMGWYYVNEGTHYPLQKSDWPDVQLPTFPCP